MFADDVYVQRADLLVRRLHRGDDDVRMELQLIARQQGATELKRGINDYRRAVWSHGRLRDDVRVAIGGRS
jgi:hypothetical protein